MYQLQTIESDGIKVTFKTPLVFQPIKKKGRITFQWPELEIYSWADTAEEAFEEFKSDIMWVFMEYGCEKDEVLSWGARILKNYLQGIAEVTCNKSQE